MEQDQIINLSCNILSHVQNLDNEDAQEFMRLYLLSLPDIEVIKCH